MASLVGKTFGNSGGNSSSIPSYPEASSGGSGLVMKLRLKLRLTADTLRRRLETKQPHLLAKANVGSLEWPSAEMGAFAGL